MLAQLHLMLSVTCCCICCLAALQVTPLRVTHSIPDCCGLILRSEHGSIVHTGDWKIDEDPVDGEAFDRTTFDLLSEFDPILT
jgi:mRNA degradation ribonuclease J1/J2